jgi:hypothetical protein
MTQKTTSQAGERTHTPGPWTVGINSNTGTPELEIYGRNGQCCVAAELGNGPEAEANARLIATAPDLLKALRAILMDADELLKKARMTPQFRNGLEHHIASAHAAIAKASK